MCERNVQFHHLFTSSLIHNTLEIHKQPNLERILCLSAPEQNHYKRVATNSFVLYLSPGLTQMKWTNLQWHMTLILYSFTY